MARTENRTEIHRKFAEQIKAIESVATETKGVATETKGVATAIDREDSMVDIPDDLVIPISALIRALLQDECFRDGPPTPVNEIAFDRLSGSITDAQAKALRAIGFDDNKLKELYSAICTRE